jgi:hypothetical protein
VTSKAHARFWESFQDLSPELQEIAREKHRLWLVNPFHPSLRFRQIRDDLWSVRINRGIRALGIRQGDEVTWFWIGSHKEYNRLL